MTDDDAPDRSVFIVSVVAELGASKSDVERIMARDITYVSSTADNLLLDRQQLKGLFWFSSRDRGCKGKRTVLFVP